MRHPRPRQEEDAEQHERHVPRVIGVGEGRQRRSDEARVGQRLLGPGSVDERAGRGDGNDGLHGGLNLVIDAAFERLRADMSSTWRAGRNQAYARGCWIA